MGLSVKMVSHIDELATYKRRWSALLERSATNEPTLSPAWLLSWWDVFGDEDKRKLSAMLFFEGERLVGLAPLLVRRHWYPPAIPFRRVELLASGEPDQDAICSEYLGVIAERGMEAPVAFAVVEALVSGALGPWDELVLPLLDGSGPMPALVAETLGKAGFLVALTTQSLAPYIPLPNTWDGYLAALPSQRRYVASRAMREFDQWAAGTLAVREVRTASDLEEGKRVLFALHAERWQEEGRSGVFASPRFSAFHDRVLPALLEQGALECFGSKRMASPLPRSTTSCGTGVSTFIREGASSGFLAGFARESSFS